MDLSNPPLFFDDNADRADVATRRGTAAFTRLLELAETRDSGQIRRVVRFVAAAFNGEAFPWDPYELRTVDVAIGDDMLCCRDALRWGRADLHTLVLDGNARVLAVLARRGVRWPQSEGTTPV